MVIITEGAAAARPAATRFLLAAGPWFPRAVGPAKVGVRRGPSGPLPRGCESPAKLGEAEDTKQAKVETETGKP